MAARLRLASDNKKTDKSNCKWNKKSKQLCCANFLWKKKSAMIKLRKRNIYLTASYHTVPAPLKKNFLIRMIFFPALSNFFWSCLQELALTRVGLHVMTASKMTACALQTLCICWLLLDYSAVAVGLLHREVAYGWKSPRAHLHVVGMLWFMSQTWTNRACPLLLLCFCVHFSLYGPFTCISFHKFSPQLSVFSFCSFGLISAVLVLSTIYLFEKVSLSPDIILCGWLGLKH